MESTLIADWSELPSDIVEYLTSFFSLSDYHRFGAVCRNWFSIANKKRRHPPRQLPWLVMGEDDATHKHKFFSIEENKHYLIDIPELHGQVLCGSSYGWLFTLDIEFKFRLVNPFTKKCYNMPPIPPYNKHFDIRKYEKEEFKFQDMQIIFVSKAILDKDPSRCSDFKVLIMYGGRPKLAYWSLGDSAWTLIRGVYPVTVIDDILFFKENFYAVGRSLSDYYEIHIVNVGLDPKIKRVGPKIPKNSSSVYLVDYMGQLLLVQRWRKMFDSRVLTKKKIIVQKIDLEEEKYSEYKPVDGHYTVFIGANLCVTVDPSKYPGCKKNALYLTDMRQLVEEETKCKDLWIYDMAETSFSRYYISKSYIPYLAFSIWLTPNLT